MKWILIAIAYSHMSGLRPTYTPIWSKTACEAVAEETKRLVLISQAEAGRGTVMRVYTSCVPLYGDQQ